MMIIDNLKLLSEFRHLLDNAFIQILVLAVLFDILTGMVKGLKGKQGNSTKGLSGIIKHSNRLFHVYKIFIYFALIFI